VKQYYRVYFTQENTWMIDHLKKLVESKKKHLDKNATVEDEIVRILSSHFAGELKHSKTGRSK